MAFISQEIRADPLKKEKGQIRKDTFTALLNYVVTYGVHETNV